MKKMQDETVVDDGCTYEIQDNIYNGVYEHINTKYSPVYPRVTYIPAGGLDNIKTSYLICNKEEMKKVSTQDVFPYGAKFTFKGNDYELPYGSYNTYNDKSKHVIMCKNEVLNYDGIDFDDIIYDSTSGQIRIGDEHILFEKDVYWRETDKGHYNISGWLQGHERAEGKISKLEYSRIKNHIWEKQIITKKDVNGQFLLVARGEVTFKFNITKLGTDETVITEKKFKRGAILHLTQDVEITEGTEDFQLYEFYSEKDLSYLYDHPDFWWVT